MSPRARIFTGALVGQAVRDERRGRDLAVEVLREHLDVHRRVLDAVGVREALELRARGAAAASARPRTRPARSCARRCPSCRGRRSCRRAPARPRPTRLRSFVAPSAGLQVMELHSPRPPRPSPGAAPSRSCPRISGRSSLTTVSLIRCRPEPADRVLLVLRPVDHAADLGDLELGHRRPPRGASRTPRSAVRSL